MTTHKDALRKALGFEIDPPSFVVRVKRYMDGGCVPANKSECAMWDMLAATAQPEQQPVAQVESWTNGSYHRNYKMHWFLDVPEGTKLYASPIETAANEGWISVSNGLPEKGLYIVNSTWGVRPAFKHDPAWADCFQDALTHSDEGMGHPDEKGPFRVIQYMRLPAAPQPPQENKE